MIKASFRKLIVVIGISVAVLACTAPLAAAEKSSPKLGIEELRLLAEVLAAVKDGYVDPIDDRRLVEAAIKGLLANLDADSAYLDAESFKDLKVGNDVAGVGLELGMADGVLKVVAPIEGAPAELAGLRSGDLILKIDDLPVAGMTLAQVTRQSRGKPDSPVTLTIGRKGVRQPIVVTVRREVIKVASVKSKLLETGYGYLRVAQMQYDSGPTVARHLRELYREGEPKGLVLDLRDNPGGLFEAAVGVAAAFLPKGAEVVSIDSRTEGTRTLLAAREDYARSGPDFLATSRRASRRCRSSCWSTAVRRRARRSSPARCKTTNVQRSSASPPSAGPRYRPSCRCRAALR